MIGAFKSLIKSLAHLAATFSLLLAFSWELKAESLPQKILDIHTGDVVVLSLNCSLCRVIENETSSPYSHSAVIIRNGEGEYFYAQALGAKSNLKPLADLQKVIRPGGVVHVFRNKELARLAERNPEDYRKFETRFRESFTTKFSNVAFDQEFLWDNLGFDGQEKMYCSEFVAKMLNVFLKDKIKPAPMDFSRNWDIWQTYFRGAVPQGQLGLSPADLARSPAFFFVQSLE